MRERKKTRIRRKNMGIKKLILFLILIFIIIQIIRVVVPASVTFSRYVYSVIRSYYLSSKEFYFRSDKLNNTTAYFEADNWSGVDAYEITVNMNSRKNNIEVSKDDIEYDISYDYEVYHSDGKKYDNKEDLIDFYISKTSGVIRTSANNRDYFNVSITPKNNIKLNDNDYIYIKLEAHPTSPNEETLRGEFKINIGNIGMSYVVEDEAYRPYLEVRITNTLDYYIVDEAFGSHAQNSRITIAEYVALSDADKAKCHSMIITLGFDPNKIVMDTTSNIYLIADENGDTTYVDKNNFNYVNSIKFKIDAEESKIVKFYKIDASKNYTYPFGENTERVVNVSYT